MICPSCAGPMSPNPKKLATNNRPDWICDQAIQPCGTQNGKWFNPTGAWNPKVAGPSPAMKPVKPYVSQVKEPTVVKEEPDWEKITEGKVRHGVICAMLQAGRSKEEILEDYEMWTRLIIIGSPI